MSEDSVAIEALAAELRTLGVRPGQDLLVHCSLRSAGPVAGGARSVAGALRAAIGPGATLVVPTETTLNSLSSDAFRAATAGFSEAELAAHIAAMPGFDPASTPSQGMGALAEEVRTTPGAVRSAHPQSSFAALGPRAANCVAGHELSCHLGEWSPLGWLYRADAAILLLGVGYAACTAFHLAEYRLPGESAYREYRCFTADGSGRREHTFKDIVLDAGDFATLGSRIDSEPFVRKGQVAEADCRLLPLPAAVDFAVAWPPFRSRRR
jgi:aminoglycoside N3'-acetyltransferase